MTIVLPSPLLLPSLHPNCIASLFQKMPNTLFKEKGVATLYFETTLSQMGRKCLLLMHTIT